MNKNTKPAKLQAVGGRGKQRTRKKPVKQQAAVPVK